MAKNTVFLDMDGVIANWTEQTSEKVLGIPYKEVPGYQESEFLAFVRNRTSMDKKAFKKALWEKDDTEFWLGIKKFYWADALIEMINENSYRWFFLTKPSQSVGCYEGKAKWIKKHYPRFFNKLIIMPASKGICAKSSEDILIDDRINNINDWKEAGGSTFFWEEVSGDPFISKETVEKRISDLKNLIKPNI